MSTVSVIVDGPDQAGEARRRAMATAADVGFDDSDSARAALVAMECASNLWKHGGGGELLITPVDFASGAAVEVLALDKGPGMRNVEACLRDGYSTAGSPGTGLGAIERLSSEFDIYTVPGKGTALLATIRPKAQRTGKPAKERLRVGGVSVPMRGETACGDSYAVRQFEDFAKVLVVDGLGHGPAAADAAAAACTAFLHSRAEQPVEVMQEVHGALRATRGAAAAIAHLDYRERKVRFVGIGNIAGVVHDGRDSRQMVSQPGIAGHDARSVREFTYDWVTNGLVLLYSDGIGTHWSLDAYEGVAARLPSLLAGVLYRDWNRGRDDATVVAIRETAP